MKANRQSKREAKRLFHLCLVSGLVDESRARKVVATAIASGRRDARAMLAHFLRLLRLDRARHTADIESATPLPADLRTAIRGSLTRRYGPGFTIAFGHRSELIGGVRIQVGSDVYDDTVLAGLEALERTF